MNNGQIYRLQKISEIEKQLIKRGMQEKLYIKIQRGRVNVTDSVGTTLISIGVIMAGVEFAVPLLLHLEIIAIVCGALCVFMKHMRRTLMSKAQKHYEIKTLADSKLNSIKHLISNVE